MPYSRKISKILKDLVLIMVLIFTLFPILWTVTLSFKQSRDIVKYPPSFLFTPTFDNYINALYNSPFLNYFINSGIIALGSTFLVLLLAIPAAYGIYRFNFKLKSFVTVFILFSRMVLPVAVAIPFFVVFKELNLLNTHISIILMETIMLLPLAIWLIGGYLVMVPKEFEEAAMIDGTTRFGAFLRIVLPILITSLAPISILTFIFSWNDLLFPLILSGPQTKTLTVGILNLIGYESVDWGALCATVMIASVPIIILAMIVQKQLIKGFSAEVLKG
jgi:multiple sugar transport system permease protein